MTLRSSLVALLLAGAALSGCGGDDGAATTPPTVPTPTPAPTPAPTPTPTPAPTPGFTAIRTAIDASPVANVSVAIGTRDGTIFRYQKGNFSPTAITPIASATKMLSGVTIMRLVEAGRMSLSDNPQKYLPYWTSDPADPRSRVTLRQLLSFTSGFNAGEDDRDTCIFDGDTTIAACARSYYDAGLQSAPGAAFSYGPAHLQIAGAMAEAATGLSFPQLFRQQVGDVAGMTRTDYLLASRTNPRLSGGATSTVDDYAAFLNAMLNGRLLADTGSYIADRTAGLPVLYAPDAVIKSGQWHYALSSWRECDAPTFTGQCATQRLVSSPGAFGWTPWIDYDRGYWAVIGMFDDATGGVTLEQQLQPLINTYLGQP